jgi:hypothetical protein
MKDSFSDTNFLTLHCLENAWKLILVLVKSTLFQYKDIFYNYFHICLCVLLSLVNSRALKRRGEVVIFTGAQGLKGPKRTKFISFWVIFRILGPEKCNFFSNSGSYIEILRFIWGPEKDKQNEGGRPKFLLGSVHSLLRPWSILTNTNITLKAH